MVLLQNIRTAFTAFLIAGVLFSCGNEQQKEEVTEHVPVEINMDNLTVVNYKVEGMVCAMGCAATIQEEVVGMPGVAEGIVDYDLAKAHFEFDASIVSEEELIAKIEHIADGQYKVKEWTEPLDEEINVEDTGGNSADKSKKIEVHLPSFEIPNLFTLILDQI